MNFTILVEMTQTESVSESLELSSESSDRPCRVLLVRGGGLTLGRGVYTCRVVIKGGGWRAVIR